MSGWRLSIQENLLPAGDALSQWEAAAALGYDAIELRGQAGDSLGRRLPELQAARVAGAVYSSVCIDMTSFIGSFDAEERHVAVTEVTHQLAAIAALGGVGVVTPGSFGLYSAALSARPPARAAALSQEILLEGLATLARRAEELGVKLLLEPLNRYEDFMVNTLAEAAWYVERISGAGIGVVADSFHANIEEIDVAAALVRHAPVIAHVQVSDSNRGVPGEGHFDWRSFLHTLDALGYSGTIAVECQVKPETRQRLGQVRSLFDRVGRE